MTEASHVAFGWCHSQEMWKNVASAELHSCSMKKRVGLFRTCFISVILLPQLHPAVISNSRSGIRIPMAVVALCLWSENRYL